MDQNQPVKVMLRAIKEVQLFLISHPEPGRELTNMMLITHALIKLNKAGLYSTLIECWQAKDPTNCATWAQFRLHAIKEYEKLIAEGTGPRLA